MPIMIRSFLPVGQGAFYLERFKCRPERINVIYDCGSGTDVDLVKKRIDKAFKPGETIHAVFISHFHKDHINGLEHLLTNYQVKRLFFPLLTKESKILLRLHYLSSGTVNEDSFLLRFTDDPKSALGEFFREHNIDRSLTLHPVIPDQTDDDYNDELEKLLNRDTNQSARIPVQPVISGQSVSQEIVGESKKEWLYVPFNFREEARCKILREALCKVFGPACSPEDLLEGCIKDPSMIDKIKDAYKEVPGNFNTNSLVLFSGCKDLDMIQCMACDGYYHPCYLKCCSLPSGCLYTGDYDASGKFKWNDLDSAYKDYYDYIGCLQIPHHGSRYNFNVNFLSLPYCALYIASAGSRNMYHHPHGSVIRDILNDGKRPIIVNEHLESAVRLYIYHL